MMRSQSGFTLIELMLSIIMGAVTTAAATTMYITSQKTLVAQNSLSSNQVAADKGLEFISKQVQKAGMGRQYGEYTATTPGSAVIVSATNYEYAFLAPKIALSQTSIGSSFMTRGSDQLVIRYTPIETGGYDCEGRPINTLSHDVVERYFVEDSESGSGLSLFCDAGRFVKSPTASLVDIGTGSVEIIPNVDLLKVKLVTSSMNSNGAESLRVMDISDYKALTVPRKVVGVKLGLVSHSNETVGHAGTSASSTGVGGNDGGASAPAGIRVFNETFYLNPSVLASSTKYRYSVNVRTISLYDGSGSYK